MDCGEVSVGALLLTPHMTGCLRMTIGYNKEHNENCEMKTETFDMTKCEEAHED